VPFLALHWLSVERPHTPKQIASPTLAFVAPLALLIGPFFLWNPRAFVEDTVLFIIGGIPDSYPIGGMSLRALLAPSQPHTQIFSILQWAVPLPLLALTGYLTWRQRSLRTTLALQTVFFAVTIFFGRFLNVQYVGYLLIQLVLSLWIREPADQAPS